MQMQWGKWRLDGETLELVHVPENYAIELAYINTSAEALDWIMQVHNKTWCSTRDFLDFVTALDTILAFQANYCSNGLSKEASGAALAARYIAGQQA